MIKLTTLVFCSGSGPESILTWKAGNLGSSALGLHFACGDGRMLRRTVPLEAIAHLDEVPGQVECRWSGLT